MSAPAWTWEEHQLSEGFSCIVYDEHGQGIADHLDRATAAKIAAAPELASELAALVTAVRFADPPKMFNGVLCYEARVPVAFVEGAEAALAKARTPVADGEGR